MFSVNLVICQFLVCQALVIKIETLLSMEFKKTFSSNLQNLHVKKTMIMVPPPELSNHSSLHQDSLGQSPLVHRHCRSTLQQPTSSDKENAPLNRELGQCLSDSRHKSVQRNGNSPTLLTFHSIRQQMSEFQHPPRKALASIPQNHPPLIHSRSNSEYKGAAKQSGQLSSSKDRSGGVRLGSMVFSSMPRRSREGKLRESRSYERLRSVREESSSVECMNNDGQMAKYKVADSQTELEDVLYYCFNCAIPLVKQGFTIEELTFQDRQRLSAYSSQSGQSRSYRSTQMRYSSRMKLGEQIKCKIIPKINRLKAAKEEFGRQVTSNTDSIDYYYQAIARHIQQQREKDQQDYHRIVKSVRLWAMQQRMRPEQYQQQLSSALGTVDYLLKHPQGLSEEALADVEEVVAQEESRYPQRQSIEPREGFQAKIQQFVSMFDQHFKLKIEAEAESMLSSRRNTFDYQPAQRASNNSMRFSFESALEESKRYQSQRGLNRKQYEMRPLEQEDESECEDSLEEREERQDAFRNLFPEDGEEWSQEMDRHKVSPVFKQF